jgi:hypothetical protein
MPFFPPKMRCYGNKLHHMYVLPACRITVKFNGIYVLRENFRENLTKTKNLAKRNFAKIFPFSHDFRIFAKI